MNRLSLIMAHVKLCCGLKHCAYIQPGINTKNPYKADFFIHSGLSAQAIAVIAIVSIIDNRAYTGTMPEPT
ncbi:hypothetical protein CRM79_02465 [Pantoea agglomerans]|nr:hypothetical protein CRM79_02465 [Pantoea agglomerans]